MIVKIFAVLFGVILLTSFSMVFADTQLSKYGIDVFTDKANYEVGDTVEISVRIDPERFKTTQDVELQIWEVSHTRHHLKVNPNEIFTYEYSLAKSFVGEVKVYVRTPWDGGNLHDEYFFFVGIVNPTYEDFVHLRTSSAGYYNQETNPEGIIPISEGESREQIELKLGIQLVVGYEFSDKVNQLLTKGDAYSYFDTPQKAFFYYDEALKEDPTNSIAQKGKDNSYNKIQEIENELDVMLQGTEGQNTIQVNFGAGIVTFSKNDYVNWVKTIYYSKLGEYDKALSHANKIRSFPEDEYFVQMAAPTLVKINADKKAIELINDALKYYITHQGQAEKLGYNTVKALWKLGKFQEALDFSERAPTDGGFVDFGFREDAYANNHIMTGILYQKLDNLEKADHYYNLALNTGYRAPFTGLTDYPVRENNIQAGIVKFLFDVGEYQNAVQFIESLKDGSKKDGFLKAVEYDRIIHDPSSGGIVCGEGTVENEKGQCVLIQTTTQQQSRGGGCLIATATFGSELAPQVQQLREIRDNSLLQTESGSAFMESFNQFYYSFSPVIADLERENPIFKEAVKITITPLITSLSILNYVDIDSDAEVLGYGISLILLNVGMYFVAPVLVVIRIYKTKWVQNKTK